jgi:hypothetical protein
MSVSQASATQRSFSFLTGNGDSERNRNERTQHPMGEDLMRDLPALLAPECAALYRQLAIKLSEVAMGDMDDKLRSDFLKLAGQYDVRAANIWPPKTGRTADSRRSMGALARPS